MFLRDLLQLLWRTKLEPAFRDLNTKQATDLLLKQQFFKDLFYKSMRNQTKKLAIVK